MSPDDEAAMAGVLPSLTEEELQFIKKWYFDFRDDRRTPFGAIAFVSRAAILGELDPYFFGREDNKKLAQSIVKKLVASS